MGSKPIEVADYDPKWPVLFAEIAARVRAVFTDGSLACVEHVGSTSVAGLPAKPIVDIDVVIPTRANLPDAITRLAALGYEHQGDMGIPSREAFRRPPESPRHNLYVCAQDSPELQRHLAFRDYLRAHPDAARQYGELKRELAARHVSDRDAYVDGKAEFIRDILQKAGVGTSTEQVEVVDYDPCWPELFAAEAASLRSAFGASLVALEHIGSTSVPGLAAKPVIDIQAVVRNLAEAQAAVPALAGLGYEPGVFARDPERRLFFKKFSAEGRLTHHLHVYAPDHPAHSEHLLFRDHLRLHPDEAQRYCELKQQLAQQYRQERVAYSHAKTEYIEAVLNKAKESLP